jgi:hypothetical protein
VLLVSWSWLRNLENRPLRSGTRMSVRHRNLSHAVPHTVPVRRRLVWTSLVWWGCLPNTTHQRICSVCAISGLLRVKRPHVNASRNIRPRSVVLLLRIHFCRPNELAVSSSPLCTVRPTPGSGLLRNSTAGSSRSIVNRVSQPGVCFLRPRRRDGLLVRRVCAPPSSAATTRPPAKMSNDRM